MLFQDKASYRSYIAVMMTYTLDMLAFAIVIPVMAYLLLSSEGEFFKPNTSVEAKALILAGLVAIFGVAQFLAAPFVGAAADRYGRRTVFLISVASSCLPFDC